LEKNYLLQHLITFHTVFTK